LDKSISTTYLTRDISAALLAPPLAGVFGAYLVANVACHVFAQWARVKRLCVGVGVVEEESFWISRRPESAPDAET
jgi:hypothetical protein